MKSYLRACILSIVVWPAYALASANLNPDFSLCLDLRNASAANGQGACQASDADCPAGLQCTDDDDHPMNGGLCTAQACYAAGELVTVDLELGATPGSPVCLGQFYMAWDTGALQFVSLQSDPDFELGWSHTYQQMVDTAAGTIDLMVALPIGAACSSGSTLGGTVARLTFLALQDCDASGVWFRTHLPPTRVRTVSVYIPLVGCNGESAPSATDTMTVQEPPAWTCPPSTTGPADCASLLRTVTYPPITVSDACGAPPPPVEELCLIRYYPGCDGPEDCSFGDCVDGSCTVPFEPEGVDPSTYFDCSKGCSFLPGLTRITCSHTNACGQTGECETEIYNTGQNVIVADIQLSPQMLPGSPSNPITRCIDFELRVCGNPNPVVVQSQEVVFGAPEHIAGFGQAVLEVPPGNYDCIVARDVHHSLPSGCTLSCPDGDVWHTEFSGTPTSAISTCNWLTQGNLNEDVAIDIIDFTIIAGLYLTVPGVTSPCTFRGFHGDLNGDGLVSVPDVTFVIQNYGKTKKAPCGTICGPFAADGGGETTEPRRSITVNELNDMGLGAFAAMADLNADAVVDGLDVDLFLELHPQPGRVQDLLQPAPPQTGR